MISIIIPFASKDPRREKIFWWVTNRWLKLKEPSWEIVFGRSDPDNFNRSAARNEAIQKSSGDILLITDADTACNMEQVHSGIAMVESGEAPWVIAHTEYWSLSRENTDDLLEYSTNIHLSKPRPGEYNWVMRSRSQAGVLIVPRAAFEEVQYDERFNGWGYEDNAFADTLNAKWGQAKRTPGDMFHLWHDPGENFKQPHIKENERLYEAIKAGL